MIKRNIFESPARMPQEGGAPMSKDIFDPNYASPLTVHSIMTPADAHAVRAAEYPRNNWLDVKNVRKGG